MTGKILVTRPLPAPVLARIGERFDMVVRGDTQPMTEAEAEAEAALAGHDGILPTPSDPFNARAFAAAPDARCRILVPSRTIR